jgi:3'-5' exoribonuclease
MIAATLRDRHLVIVARTIHRVELHAHAFRAGEVVEVVGRPRADKGVPSMWLSSIVRSSAPDAESLLPWTYRDLDELDGFLEGLADGEVREPACRALLADLLQDAALRKRWRSAACNYRGAYAYCGALLEHTVAVATLAAETATLHSLDRSLLVTAALVHDLGIALEPSRRPGARNDAAALARLQAAARSAGMPARRLRALVECLSSSSETAPASVEAAALRAIDQLDMAVAESLFLRGIERRPWRCRAGATPISSAQAA